jgi:hypothetical protein
MCKIKSRGENMDRITQSEIKALVSAKDAIDETEQAIMLRMAAGAEVEPGDLSAKSEFRPGGDQAVEECVLEIETAEQRAEFAAYLAEHHPELAAAHVAA